MTPPILKRKTEPIYPEKALKARVEGVVVLTTVVGTDGKPREIHVEKSLTPELDEQAIAAVQNWEFQPATLDGKAVAMKLNVQVQFRLTQSSNSLSGNPPKPPAASPIEMQNLTASAGDAYSRRDYAAAARFSRQLTELVPQSRNAWNLLGMSLLELNQFDAAADALKKQIEIDPGSPFAYNNLGRVYQRQHKYDLAVEQFKKQLAINPQDRYAHANLGVVLYAQKKYAEAVPELEKALEITPNNSSVLLTLGECDVQLGNNDKGVDELSRATSTASSPSVWNNAAYQLATHNLDLDRAQKWAESAVEIESAGLRDVSLQTLTPVQMERANALATYWDTLGWVHFVRGDAQGAEPYLRAAWELRPIPVVGDHLGQVYEKLGKRDNALHIYAMALASKSNASTTADPESIAELRQRLSKLSETGANTASLSDAAQTELTKMQSVSIPNPEKASGTADFSVLLTARQITDAREVTGSPSLKPMIAALRSSKVPMDLPPSSGVQIPRRGTLNCAGQSECRFVMLSSDEALDIARKEAGSEAAAKVIETARNPAVYDNPGMGVRIKLPEDWKLSSEQPGSYSQPATVTFRKPGTLAAIFLGQQHLEASPELFRRLMEENVLNREDFNRTSSTSIVRDGIQGDRWGVTWKEKGVSYRGIMEFFSAEDQHYYVLAAAPAEVFEKYSQNFEDTLHSTQFPILHISAKDILSKSQ